MFAAGKGTLGSSCARPSCRADSDGARGLPAQAKGQHVNSQGCLLRPRAAQPCLQRPGSSEAMQTHTRTLTHTRLRPCLQGHLHRAAAPALESLRIRVQGSAVHPSPGPATGKRGSSARPTPASRRPASWRTRRRAAALRRMRFGRPSVAVMGLPLSPVASTPVLIFVSIPRSLSLLSIILPPSEPTATLTLGSGPSQLRELGHEAGPRSAQDAREPE